MGKLTSAELYFIISTALVHDIGMVVSETDLKNYRLTPAEIEQVKRHLPDTEQLNNECLYSGYGIWRSILANYYRSNHARRSGLALNSELLPIILLTENDEKRKKYIGRIAESHTLDFDSVSDQSFLPTDILIDEQRVNTRFVAICLRIGDLLDINTNRTCPLIRKLSEPLPYLSAAHWDQYKHIELHDPKHGKDITIEGDMPTVESHRLLKDWVRWLSKELSESTLLLNTCDPRDVHYCLRVGRVADRLQPKCGTDGTPLYELLEYKFNLDEERIFKRIFGNRLYGKPELAIRELIQNAIDATRFRVAHEIRHTNGKTKISLRDAAYLKLLGKYPIKIYVNRVTENDHVNTYVSFEDQGVGMSRQIVCDYLLKVGRSRWKEDTDTQAITTDSIGEFGIGFISLFMIADDIVIETRSMFPMDTGLKASIKSWNSYIIAEPLTNSPIGTKITIRLRQEFADKLYNDNAIFKKYVPFTEIPIEIYHDNLLTTTVPQRATTSKDEVDRPTVKLFCDRSGSIATITQSKRDSYQSFIAQDGILVPEARQLSPRTPLTYTMEKYGLRCDLRGKSKYSLDLSRNMFMGETHKVWPTVASRVIRALLLPRNNRYEAVSRLINDYVDTEYMVRGIDSKIAFDSRFRLHKLSDMINDGKDIFFTTAASLELKNLRRIFLKNDKLICCLLPSPTIDDNINTDDYYIKRLRKIAGIDTNRYRKLTGEVADKNDLDAIPPIVASSDIYATLCGTCTLSHSRIAKGPHGVCYFSNSDGVLLKNVAVFALSSAIWIARLMSSNRWAYIPSGYLEDLFSVCRKLNVDYNGFIQLLYYTVDSHYQFWGIGKWFDKPRIGLTRYFERVSRHTKKMADYGIFEYTGIEDDAEALDSDDIDSNDDLYASLKSYREKVAGEAISSSSISDEILLFYKEVVCKSPEDIARKVAYSGSKAVFRRLLDNRRIRSNF